MKRTEFPAVLRPVSVLALLASMLVLLVLPSLARAAAPVWSVDVTSFPTYLEPGGSARYMITAFNVGDARAQSGVLTVTDSLPGGMTIESISTNSLSTTCSGVGTGVLTCNRTLGAGSSGSTPEIAREGDGTPSFSISAVSVTVNVPAGLAGSPPITNSATASGGGAAVPATGSITLPVTSTPPGFGIFSLSAEVRQGPTGGAATQAGSHPYDAATTVTFNSAKDLVTGSARPAGGDARTIKVDLPPGFVANPEATPKCSRRVFEESVGSDKCPPAARVGVLHAWFGPGDLVSAYLYNLVPEHGSPAQLGGWVLNNGRIQLSGELNSDGNYDISVIGSGEQLWSLHKVKTIVWGVPADKNFAGAARRPFISNPTDCSHGPLDLTVNADTWQNPGVFTSATIDTDINGESLHVENCTGLEPFAPTIGVQPTTTQADSASGLDVNLHLPQSQDPDGLASPVLRDSKVVLPEGMTINPSAGAVIDACSSEQVGLTSARGATPIRFDKSEPSCPDASKVGTVSIKTPLLADPLEGTVYLAIQDDNPFKSLIALYIVAEDDSLGLIVKLAGRVDLDPQTGRLTATFEDNPQLPFEDLDIHFPAGERASLATPQTCGTYTTETELTPFSAAPQFGSADPASPPSTPSDSAVIDAGPSGSPCPASLSARPFAPSFSAGTVNPLAGAKTPFVLKLSRADGEQEPLSLDVSMPPGFAAVLKGVPACTDGMLAAAAANTGRAEQATPSCPAASQVGTVVAGAGAGTPLYVSGKAYLSGPYKGAPLSLAIVTPAVAGPFDLGVVVVRAALYVNSKTAQITAKSDPIPQMLKGIPLRLRSVAVSIDRPDFTLNPTSCNASAVSATVAAATGGGANLANRFQVGGCENLGFAPKLELSLKGGTRRAKFPALKAVLTQLGGEANISFARVLLPRSEFLEQGHIGTVCTRVEFAADQCPEESVYGRATAWSPLLDEPLTGSVYLRANGGERELPDLVAALNGPASMPIEIELVGYVDSVNGRLRNTFAVVPDAPVSRFELEMLGGKKGLLVNSENLCKLKKNKRRAVVNLIGQNGRRADQRPLVQNQCRKEEKRRRARERRPEVTGTPP